MRPKPPGTLTERLTLTQLREVSTWWRHLTRKDRRSLSRLLDDPPRRLRLRLLGRIHTDADPFPSEADDFYEYLVNHEITLDDGRKFHICSAHEEARALVMNGVIPAGFVCPRAIAGCPMRTILDHTAGCSVRLEAVREEHEHE
jgi:hypothetical protein